MSCGSWLSVIASRKSPGRCIFHRSRSIATNIASCGNSTSTTASLSPAMRYAKGSFFPNRGALAQKRKAESGKPKAESGHQRLFSSAFRFRLSAFFSNDTNWVPLANVVESSRLFLRGSSGTVLNSIPDLITVQTERSDSVSKRMGRGGDKEMGRTMAMSVCSHSPPLLVSPSFSSRVDEFRNRAIEKREVISARFLTSLTHHQLSNSPCPRGFSAHKFYNSLESGRTTDYNRNATHADIFHKATDS